MGKKTPFGQLQCLCYVHNTARALASGYRTRVELPAPPLPWILTFGGWLSAPCNFVSLPLVPGLVTVRYQVQPLRPLNSPSLFLPVFLSFLSPPRLLLFLSFFLTFFSSLLLLLLLLFTPFAILHIRASLLNASTLTSLRFQTSPGSVLSPYIPHGRASPTTHV